MPTHAKHYVILLALGCLLLFTRLGAAHLWDLDEALFSQAAWEMDSRGDWVVPYFNGEIFPDKPPLMYWLMILGYKVFGATEFAARCGSAVCGIATMLLTYHIGRRLFSPAVGLWGAIVLGSSLNFAVIGRAATPDALLVLFSTMAMWIFVAGTLKRRGVEQPAAEVAGSLQNSNAGLPAAAAISFTPASLATWIGVYAAMGVAVLDKGPVGVVLPTAAIGLFLLIANRRKAPAETAAAQATQPGGRLAYVRALAAWSIRAFAPRNFFGTIWSMRPLTALAAVLLVAGPWYAMVGIQTHGAWLVNFLGVHNVGRFLSPMENHRGPFFYYLPALAVGCFPWSLLVMLGVVRMVRSLYQNDVRRLGYAFLMAWSAVWIGFFSFSGTKLPSYVVPAYPALALAASCLLCDWLKDSEAIARVWLRLGWSLLALSGLGILVVMPILANVFLGGDFLVGLVGVVPLVGAAACFYFCERDRRSHVLVALVATAVAFVVGLLGFVVPRVDRHQNSAELAEVIFENQPEGDYRVSSFHHFRPSLVFYTRRKIEHLSSRDDVARFFGEQAQGGFLFTTDEQYQQIASALPRGVTILESTPRFLKPGKVLLLGRATAEDGPPAWRPGEKVLQAGKRGAAAR